MREFANLPQFLGGEVLCQFDDYVDFKGLKLGRIVFQGTLTGANFQELAAGGSAKVQVNGALYFDDKTKRIHSMRTMAERDIFDRANNLVGSMKDDFQLAIQFLEDDADLTDAIIGPLQAEPTEAKLMLLYEQPGLGIRIMHPRRWELASVVGNQLLFEFNEGSKNSSVVFNVEREGKTPTTREFFEEVTASLNAKKTEFRQRGKVEEVESSAGRLGNFRLQCTLDNLPRILDYWTLEIKKRGITVSSRLSVDDVKIAADDIETMVRGIHFLPPLTQVKLSDRTEIPQPTRKAIPAAKNP